MQQKKNKNFKKINSNNQIPVNIQLLNKYNKNILELETEIRSLSDNIKDTYHEKHYQKKANLLSTANSKAKIFQEKIDSKKDLPQQDQEGELNTIFNYVDKFFEFPEKSTKPQKPDRDKKEITDKEDNCKIY
jgi:hypothetical protein